MEDNTKAHPPVALVKTWIALITSNEPDDVRKHAGEMLIRAFGGMEEALAFAKEHNLINAKDKPQRATR